MPWKDYPFVELDTKLPIWSCADCGEFLINAAQTKELDKEIRASIQSQVLQFISIIVQREKCEQKELALRLGVSPEYLSEIKSGRKIPSFQTFNFLKTMFIESKAYAASSPHSRAWKKVPGN